MKTVIIAGFAFVFFVMPFAQEAQAAISVTEINRSEALTIEEDALFGVNLKEVNKIQGTNTLKFDMETVDIQPSPAIDHWKIRFWCEGDVQVGITRMANQCGQAVTLPFDFDQTKSLFNFFATKIRGDHTQFSFKLKAYDKNGDWLHSEEERFQ